MFFTLESLGAELSGTGSRKH